TAKELVKASVSFNLIKGTMEHNLTDPQEREALRRWRASGLIDSTRAHDLAGIAESSGYAYSDLQHKWMDRIAKMFHRAEQLNREATAIAAYRLARRKGVGHEAAIKQASDLTWDAHFDYTNVNRARFMQSDFMKVATQFKQYSQNMTYFLLRNLEQSLRGATKEEKKIARRQLVGSLGVTALMGGLNALPLWMLYGLADLAMG